MKNRTWTRVVAPAASLVIVGFVALTALGVQPPAPTAAQSQLREAYKLVDTWDGAGRQGAPGSLLDPAGIELGTSFLYVVDRGNDRVQAFTPQGAFSRAWGQRGSGPSDLMAPQDVAVDGQRVYVTDRGNGRVVVYDLQGLALEAWTAPDLKAPWGISAHGGRVYVTNPDEDEVVVFADGAVVGRWSDMADPRGIEVGTDGQVYVAQQRASSIGLFNPDGTAAGSLGVRLAPLDVAVDEAGDVYVQSPGAILWYPAGAVNSKLAMYQVDLQGVAVSSRFGIFGTVSSDARQFHGVVQYPWRPRDGRPLGEWGLLAYPPGRLNAPRAIHAGPEGLIWILDGWPRVQALDAEGHPQKQFLLPAQRVNVPLPRQAVDVVAKVNGEVVAGEPRFIHRLLPDGTLSGTLRLGQGTTHFWLTAAARPDNPDRVLMLDSALMAVRSYGITATIKLLDSWPLAATVSPDVWQLYGDLAVPEPNPASRWYIINRSAHEIEVYEGGQLVGSWVVEGIPARGAVGPDGHLFLLMANGIVWKYTPEGSIVAGWDAGAFSAGGSEIADLTVGADGRVFTVDRIASTVRVWEIDPAGTPEAPRSRGGACRLRGDKRAAPETLRLGQTVDVRLEIGGECPNSAPQADIILAIDRSGSMNQDDKITTTIEAALVFINSVDLSRDRVGIVTFNNTGQLAQSLTGNRVALETALRNILAVGGTNIADAIRVSADELFGERRRPNALAAIILLTDGIDREPDDVLEAAHTAKERGARIFTIGFGEVDPMVMVLSASTPEDHYYSPDTTQLADIYSEIARRLVATVLARAMTVVDEVPRNMRYVVGSAQPLAAWDPAGRTLTWRLMDVPFAGLTLSYRLEPQDMGLHPTNVEASADFTDGLNQNGELDFPVPRVNVVPEDPTPTPTSTPFPTPTPTPRPPEPLFLPIVLRQKCEDLQIHADLALVMDTSGSMNDPSREGGVTKLAAAVKAARQFVNRLNLPEDRAAVVSFNSTASLVQELTGDRELLLAALDGLETLSGTRIDLGLEEALAELTGERARTDQSRVIVLLTDGRGSVPNEQVLEVAERAREARLLIFTIGLGTPQDVDYGLLRQIASRPDYFYEAPSTDDLERIYSAIVFTLKCVNLNWP